MKVLKHLSQRNPLEPGKTSIIFSIATNRKKLFSFQSLSKQQQGAETWLSVHRLSIWYQ